MRRLLWVGVALLCLAASPQGRTRFATDFETGLGAWDLRGAGGAVATRPSGDPERGQVLVLAPAGDDVLALLPRTASWVGVRMRGRFRFPADDDPYLGLVYNFTERDGGRADFGVVYVKGEARGSYLQPNPHRDRNVGRLLYPEYHVDLSGAAAVRIGEWQTFGLEVVGRSAHVYVGPAPEPALTFDLFEGGRGAVGLQPRSVGGAVWVDDVEVEPIDRLSWTGPARPAAIAYGAGALLGDWQVLGPLPRTDDRVAREPLVQAARWQPFATDARGAVISGRLVDTHGPRSVAYFRTTVQAAAAREALLHVSGVDDLGLWLNGHFEGFYARGSAAWWDFFRNPEHAGRRIPVALRAGANDVVIRVRGGVYASGGFYARIE